MINNSPSKSCDGAIKMERVWRRQYANHTEAIRDVTGSLRRTDHRHHQEKRSV